MSGKILKLNIESFKGLVNVDLDWDNEYAIMAIIADGGLGKTSLVTFVKACLTGIVEEEDINLATQKAKGSLDFILNDKKYTVDISKTKKSETVKIRSENNMSGGKEVLRSIVGNVSFSVLSLIKLDTGKQISEFKKIFHIDTTEKAAKRKVIYDSRTLINKQIEAIKGYLVQNNVDEAFKKKIIEYQNEKELGDLPEQLKRANEISEQKLLKGQDHTNNNAKITTLNDDIFTIDKQIALLQKQKEEKQEQINNLNKENEKIMEDITVIMEESLQNPKDELEKKIKDINDFNTERNKVILTVKKIQEMEALQKQSAGKTDELIKMDEEIETYVKSKIPDLGSIKLYEKKVEEDGTVTEDREGIYFEDKPISILSTTEAISFGMKLKAAINPDGLPIILLDDFESVGSIGRAALEDMASKGWQALVAEVDSKQSNLKVVLKNNLHDTEEKVIKA